MLDRLFMKYLSKTGIKLYWVGQLVLDAIFIYYLFGIAGYSMDEDSTRNILIGGVLAVAVAWGLVCLLFWRKKNEAPADGAEEEAPRQAG